MSHIPLQPVESSQLAAIGYDPETQTLAIQFKAKGDYPASTYHYANFTPEDWAEFQGAKSKGSHFYAKIKPQTKKYPFKKQ